MKFQMLFDQIVHLCSHPNHQFEDCDFDWTKLETIETIDQALQYVNEIHDADHASKK